MSLPLSLVAASTDPEFRGHLWALPVLIQLHTHLDVAQYRRVKQRWLARRLGISQPEVSRSLKRLRDRGYLERNAAGLYRATLSPLPVQPAARAA